MKRREFIKTSGLSAITAWAGSSLLLSACHTEEDMIGEDNWIVEGSFNQPLFRPAIVEGNTSLNVQTTTGQMLNGSSSSILSYRNGLLGNTIKATQGGTVSIQVQNNLSEETNIHWHGLIVPEDMDGHPKDLIAGGGSFTYTLPINQRAGTYWYHPHPHEATARQVFMGLAGMLMGLAGMFIVTDSEEAALNLPSGDFEIPLIIQDKRFSGSSLDYSPSEDEIMMGYLGEHIIVNGIYAPVASIAKGWQRFRVLNGSTARVYNLAFSNGMSFHVIGADGGLLATPENVNSLMLAPGERADVLVDFSGIALGQSVYLQSKKFSQYNVQGRQQFNIMKFVMEQATAPAFTLPATLSKINTIPAASAVRTRTFDIAALVGGMGGHGGMGRHSIGGKTFQMDRVDETVQANTTEI